jgi:hypothetical protein
MTARPQLFSGQRFHSRKSSQKLMEPAMADRITKQPIDAPTSRAVSNGIGEKLRQSLATEPRFPDQLQRLLDEMREREVRDASKGKSG